MIPVLRDFAAAKEALYAERLPEAVAGFLKVLERTPENVIAALNLGKCLTQLHRPEEAVEVLLRAWRLAPENTTLAADLGEAYRLAGRPKEALEPFRIAMRDPLHQWDGTLGTVRCLLATGRLGEAKELLARVSGGPQPMTRDLAGKVDRYSQINTRLEAEPGSETLKLDLAGAAFDLGLHDAAEALAEFEQAATGLPGDPQVMRHLAAFYLAAGRPALLQQGVRPCPAGGNRRVPARARTGDRDGFRSGLENPRRPRSGGAAGKPAAAGAGGGGVAAVRRRQHQRWRVAPAAECFGWAALLCAAFSRTGEVPGFFLSDAFQNAAWVTPLPARRLALD
jgi:tetratricopeptide (TPR) repeat protein